MKEEIENELRDISPFLADLKKENPFKTPKVYFDTLADRVLEKTQPVAPPQSDGAFAPYSAKKSVFSQVETWVSTLIQPRWAMAMASVAILAVGTWFYLKSAEIQTEQALTEISNDEIHQYIKENIDDFEENLLAENDFTASDTEGGTILPEMTDAEIELYLKEHLEEKDLDNINGKL